MEPHQWFVQQQITVSSGTHKICIFRKSAKSQNRTEIASAAQSLGQKFIAPWGLWYRAPRFFMFVCLSLLLLFVCLSRSDLIQNGTRKSASSEGTMEKFDQKTVPFLDMSCRIHPVTSVASLKMLLMSNYLLYVSSIP